VTITEARGGQHQPHGAVAGLGAYAALAEAAVAAARTRRPQPVLAFGEPAHREGAGAVGRRRRHAAHREAVEAGASGHVGQAAHRHLGHWLAALVDDHAGDAALDLEHHPQLIAARRLDERDLDDGAGGALALGAQLQAGARQALDLEVAVLIAGHLAGALERCHHAALPLGMWREAQRGKRHLGTVAADHRAAHRAAFLHRDQHVAHRLLGDGDRLGEALGVLAVEGGERGWSGCQRGEAELAALVAGGAGVARRRKALQPGALVADAGAGDGLAGLVDDLAGDRHAAAEHEGDLGRRLAIGRRLADHRHALTFGIADSSRHDRRPSALDANQPRRAGCIGGGGEGAVAELLLVGQGDHRAAHRLVGLVVDPHRHRDAGAQAQHHRIAGAGELGPRAADQRAGAPAHLEGAADQLVEVKRAVGLGPRRR
jgi:hypothetical protein